MLSLEEDVEAQALFVKDAVTAHRHDVLDGRAVDGDLVRLVASRCWIVVLGERHDELMMPTWMYAQMQAAVATRTHTMPVST